MKQCPPNPNANKFVLPDGYRDIGWQVDLSNPDKKKCRDAGHKKGSWREVAEIREFDNSMFLYRRTDVVTICDVCKIIDHTDMSD